MRASANTKPQQRRMQPAPDVNTLRGAIAGLLLEATRFIAPGRVEELARSWIARAGSRPIDPYREVLQVADALGMAMDIALFTPSATGSTAFDRLARARRLSEPGEADALEAVRWAQFRLLRVETVWGNDTAQLRDITSGEGLHVLDENIPSEAKRVERRGPKVE